MRAIVVGAGAVGLMSALALAERGARVVVLDAELPQAPTSASRAAAGMLAPLSEAALEPPATHPRLLELGLASLDLWADRARQLALSTFPVRGSTWKGDGAFLAALEARAGAWGRSVRRLSSGALELPHEGALDPEETLSALEAALAARGGAVRRGARAAQIEGRTLVLSDGARIAGDVVVLATGLGAPDLAPRASVLAPAKGQIFEVRSAALAPGAVLRGPGIYAVGRGGGRVVIGASMEPGRADLEPEAGVLNQLAERAGALSAELAGAERVRAWAGVRPMSVDWAPRIGRFEDVIVARGHSRGGWLLAPISAKIVSAYAFGDDLAPLWADFAPQGP